MRLPDDAAIVCASVFPFFLLCQQGINTALQPVPQVGAGTEAEFHLGKRSVRKTVAHLPIAGTVMYWVQPSA